MAWIGVLTPSRCCADGPKPPAVNDHYTFNSPVTLTLTFDPSKVPPGGIAAVYYYDGTNRVLLTGTVN